MNDSNLGGFTDILGDEIGNSQESQPLSLSIENYHINNHDVNASETSTRIPTHDYTTPTLPRPAKGTGQYGQFRSVEEIDVKYRSVFTYPFFNVVQSNVIDDAVYSDKSMVVCAPTGSGKTVVFEMAIVQLLMEIEDNHYTEDFKIIYMAPVKALCTERLTEWYPKFTKLGLLCIEVTGDTDVDFSQLKPYRIIITTPEKWDMVTRRWREHRQLVEVIKLFLIDEVHILNDETRGPVLEAVVSRMKTIESSAQSAHRIEQLQQQYQGTEASSKGSPPQIRFVAVSATVSNPEDVAAWIGTTEKPAVYYKFGDESRPVKLKRVVEGYHCPEGTSIFKFDIILNYKLWPIIQKYHNGKPTLIFCNTRKSVALTAETLSREITVSFNPEQKAKLNALASKIKNKKLQALVLSGVGCHHAGLLYEERNNIESAFRNRDLPILITTTTLAMGVNLPAHLVIIKNTQQYVNGAYQEYSISTILQMVGRAGRPQFDTEATAVIMTRLCDKPRYQALVGGSEPLQSYLHKRLAENLNSEAALGTVNDVAQCVQWLRSTFLYVRAARDPRRYLGLPPAAPQSHISKKIEELCVKAMNGLATAGLITMDEASCIESTEAGRLMSIFYLDLETMKNIMKVDGTETLERLLWIVCESHELSDMHLRVDERRVLNTLNRNTAAATIRFSMKGKVNTRQMKLFCIIQAILGCLPISDPSLNQEAMKVMRIAVRICKCLVTYITRPALIALQPKYYSAVLNSLILAKCVEAHLWENSPFVSKQLKGIGPTFSTLLATAGKINFMLLEESHPRDLERIMNKGPPAGNVLRKQVSLLPKYQLTMTPIDEKSVTVELMLLNKNYLADNIENLTAGEGHKSYIVVGDSENNLLLFTMFKDKDLISVYDGTITHQITRNHNFEHKIYAHCISSTFVGIDVQYEYHFKNLESLSHSTAVMITNCDTTLKPTVRQTTITDVFKQRKRKNVPDNDIVQSKEKKKRDTSLIETLKSLKNSFGKTSKLIKDDLNKSAVISNQILEELTYSDRSKNINNPTDTLHTPITDIIHEEIAENCDFIDDEEINSMLNEIENEISKKESTSNPPSVDLRDRRSLLNEKRFVNMSGIPIRNENVTAVEFKTYDTDNRRKSFQKKEVKSNYNFIDLLEKNTTMNQENENINQSKSCGFSNTIKNHVEKYLLHTKAVTTTSDKSLVELVGPNAYQQLKINSADDGKDQNSITNKHIIMDKIIQNNVENLSEIEVNSNIDIQNNVKASIPIFEKDPEIKEKQVQDNRRQDKTRLDNRVANYRNVMTKAETDKKINSNDITLNNADKNSSTQNMTEIKELCVLEDADKNKSKGHELILSNDFMSMVSRNHENNIATECSFLSKLQPLHLYKIPNIQRQININDYECRKRNDVKNNLTLSTPVIAENYSKPEQINTEASNNSTYNVTNSLNMDIKNYSYSATKIDVSTKNAPNCIVIRRIKMDLDVTEISSRENKINEFHNYKVKEKLNDDMVIDIENQYKENSCKDFSESSINHVKNKEKEEDLIDSIEYSNCEMNKTKSKNVSEHRADYYISPKEIKIVQESSFQLNPTTCQPSLSNQQNIAQYNAEDISESNKNLQQEHRLSNILHKYSQILNRNIHTENPAPLKGINKNLSNSSPRKAKRPFRISEIDNLNINLPEKLIGEISQREEHYNEFENNFEKQENYQHTESKKIGYVRNNMPQQFEQNMNDINHQVEQSQTILYDYPSNILWQNFRKESATQNIDMVNNVDVNVNENLPKCELLEFENDVREPKQTKLEFNIDHSMLNPKTLLQSLSKDETDDILPPPPEFCDDNRIIENQISNDNLQISTDSYEPLSWNDFYDKAYANNNIDYTFESEVELTPSKELETWTLSQSDERYENIAEPTSFIPTQPFTIMRNTGQHKSPFQNVSVTRQSKLGQFKFCRKSKLKPKL